MPPYDPSGSAALPAPFPQPDPVPPRFGRTTPLKVVHVVRQYAPGVGGLESYVAMLAASQRAAGHDAGVLTLDRVFHGDGRRLPARERIGDVPVTRVSFRGSSRYPVAPAALARLGGADIVHVHAVDSFLDMLAWTRVLHRKPLVLSTHGGFFHTGFAQRLKLLYFRTVTRASLLGVSAVLSSSAQDHGRFAPIARGKTLLVENGIDLDRFRALAAPGNRRMIYFGRLAPNKGLERLLAWFAALRACDPTWELIVAGRPMGLEPEAIAVQAARLGIAEAIELHVAPSDEALRGLIGRASVFVCASSYEGFGLAAVEAVAAGLYPVLSAIPPFARTRARIGFGTLVNFDAAPDPAAFLADLARHNAAPPSRSDVDAALSPFAWQSVPRAVEQVYARVLGRHTRHVAGIDFRVARRGAVPAAIAEAVTRRAAAIVTFGNPHTANMARRDAAYREVLRRTVVLGEGTGVALAAHLLFGRALPSRVCLPDMVCETIARLPEGTRLFVLGGHPGIAAAAAERLRRRYRQIDIAGTHHGFFAAAEEPALIEQIRAAGADLVLVGLGQPRQEYWAVAHADALGVPQLCIGGLLDLLAGAVPRAPLPVRRAGLEWAFRLAVEPRRLARRYIVGYPRFLCSVAWQWATNARLGA